MARDVKLESTRLILRPPILADFDAWALMEADESVKSDSGSVQDQRESCNLPLSAAGHWKIMGWGALCAIEKSSGRFIGRFGPSKPLGWPCIEVGWMLLPEFRGKGYALEGTVAAMGFAFLELGEARVIHTIRPANTASQKLAVRLGSKNLGPIALPPPCDAILNDEWSQKPDEWDVWRKRPVGRP